MNAHRSTLALLAASAALVLATGCSSDSGDSADDGRGDSAQAEGPRAVPGVGAVPKLSDAATVTLPIDAYDSSMDQIVKTQKARNLLTQQCVKRFGLSVEYPRLTAGQGSPHARRYGPPETLEAAQKYGFHMAVGDPRAFTPDKMKRQSTDVLAVLRGVRPDNSGQKVTSFNGQPVPEGGCSAEATQKMAKGGSEGTRVGHADMAAAIKARSFEVAKNDPRVIAAEDKWAGCMAEKGYTNYQDSFAAAADKRWNTPKATSLEIEVAAASWHCGDEANVVGTWVAVETAYQKDQIDKNAEQLKEEKERLEEESKRIDAIIAKGDAV